MATNVKYFVIDKEDWEDELVLEFETLKEATKKHEDMSSFTHGTSYLCKVLKTTVK